MLTILTETDTSFVPGWQILTPILLIMAVGIWLIFDGTRQDKINDPWTHPFNDKAEPDIWVGYCREKMDDGYLCGLSPAEHEEVYGC